MSGLKKGDKVVCIYLNKVYTVQVDPSFPNRLHIEGIYLFQPTLRFRLLQHNIEKILFEDE